MALSLSKRALGELGVRSIGRTGRRNRLLVLDQAEFLQAEFLQAR